MDNIDTILFFVAVGLALSYAFANGLNDAANALATVVGCLLYTSPSPRDS